MRPHLHPLPGIALLLGLTLLQACSDAPPGPVPQEPALMRVRVLNLQNSHSAASLSLPGRIVAREPIGVDQPVDVARGGARERGERCQQISGTISAERF